MPEPRKPEQIDQTLQSDDLSVSQSDTADGTAAHDMTIRPKTPVVPNSHSNADATLIQGMSDTPRPSVASKLHANSQATLVDGMSETPKSPLAPRVQINSDATVMEGGAVKLKGPAAAAPQISADATLIEGGIVKPRSFAISDATVMEGGTAKPHAYAPPVPQPNSDATVMEGGMIKPKGYVIPSSTANSDATVVAGEIARAPLNVNESSSDNTTDSQLFSPGSRSKNDDKTDAIDISDAPAAPSPAARPNPAAMGNMVGRFALKGLHARGGLGEVFTARDTELNREVALKRIQIRFADDPSSRRRFLSEAEITARLDHPGVVPVFGLVNDRFGRPCYAMRFIRGETLKDEIERYHASDRGAKAPEYKDKEVKASNSPDEVRGQPRSVAFRKLLQRFIAVCQAIAYAHNRKVIHRDIKPANVMVGSFGETLVVDWGLAKSLDDTPAAEHLLKAAAEAGFRHDPEATEQPDYVTMAGTAIGTPAFMPPEQASGRLDLLGPGADVYSLGATLFAILTGKSPFSGGSSETIDKVRRGDIPTAASVSPDVSPPLDAVCRKAMSFRIEDRYTNSSELSADIERWLSDEPVSCYRDPFAARLARWARRHPARVAASISLLVAGVFAAAGIALAVSREQAKTNEALVRVTQAEITAANERDQVIIEKGHTQTALKQVTDEKTATEGQRVLAVGARDAARERYDAAVKAFNVLVVNIQQTLADRAGTQDLRRDLLMEAQAGLNKLIEKGAADKLSGGDSTLIAAHRQMGDVYQLLGNTRGAREQYRKSVEMAGKVLVNAKSAKEEMTARQDHGLLEHTLCRYSPPGRKY